MSVSGDRGSVALGLGFAVLILAGLLGPTATGAAYTTLTQNCDRAYGFGNVDWDEKTILFLESDGSKAFLSTKEDAGSATQFTAASGSGLVSLPGGLQGQSPDAVELRWEAPGGRFWLNLSKPIVGTVYVSGQTYSTGNAGKDEARFRIELVQGTTTIGGVECFSTPSQGGRTPAAFPPLMFRFRPEVATLEPDQPLRLLITRVGGLADFVIGTGGSQQSRIEIRGWSHEPFQGPVAIEAGRIDGLPPPPGAAAPTNLGLPTVAPALPLLAAPLLASRRRPRAALVALVLVAVAMGGCLGAGKANTDGGDGDDGPAAPTPKVDERTVENETLKGKGIGALRGRVHDRDNLSVKAAQVLVVGSTLFGSTDKHGDFAFPNVTAGKYLLRVQHQDFLFVERGVTVEIGKTTILDIEMVRNGPDTGGTRPHTHPAFPDDGVLPLWSVDFSLQGNGGSGTCDYTDICETVIPIDPSAHAVPPGTGMVEVTLKFTKTFGYGRVGLRTLTPINVSKDQFFLPRETDKPFHIAIFPNEADPGHQKFTNWIFLAHLESLGPPDCTTSCVMSPAGALLGPPLTAIGPIHAEFKAHRGVLPFEPPHKDRWGNLTEIPLRVTPPERLSAPAAEALRDYPRSTYAFDVYGPESFVPAGTLEVRGTLSWQGDDAPAPTVTDWKVLYKAASSPNGAPVLKPVTSSTPGNGRVDFVIKVDAADVDPFYALDSGWAFYIDDGQESTMVNGQGYNVNSGYFTKWSLSATAFKDPAYVFGGAE